MPKKPQELNQSEAGYEKRDLNTGVIVGFAAIVFAMTVGAMIITFWIMRGYESNRPPLESGKALPSAELTASAIERGPRLEALPKAERLVIERPSLEQLQRYGALAGAPGRMHIPIDDAMGLIAAGVAPYKAEAPNSPSLAPAPGDMAETSGETGAR